MAAYIHPKQSFFYDDQFLKLKYIAENGTKTTQFGIYLRARNKFLKVNWTAFVLHCNHNILIARDFCFFFEFRRLEDHYGY